MYKYTFRMSLEGIETFWNGERFLGKSLGDAVLYDSPDLALRALALSRTVSPSKKPVLGSSISMVEVTATPHVSRVVR